ncbi:hypothetical protein ECEC1735_0490, partial [Escherichia coli EC1735]
IRHLSPLPDAA